MSDLICGEVAVGRNYNSTRDSKSTNKCPMCGAVSEWKQIDASNKGVVQKKPPLEPYFWGL